MNGRRGYFTLKTGEPTAATINWEVSAVAQGHEVVSPEWIFVGEKVSIKLTGLTDENITQVALSGNRHSATATVSADGVVVIPGDFIADGATITISTARTITVTSELQNITATVTSGYASEDENVSVKLVPDAGYDLPTEAAVKIGESEETSYSITDGVVTIPIGDDWAENTTVIVKAAGVQQVHLDATLTGVTATYNTPVPVPGKDFVITFKAVEGYNLPTTVKVKIGDTETDYKVQNSRITIEAAKVVAGNSIAVTANGTQKIAVNMTSFDEGLSVTYNPTVPVSGKDFTITLQNGTLPDTVTVTIDGTDKTETDGVAYTKDESAGTATISIPAALLTNNTKEITVTAVNPADVISEICKCTVQCEEGTVNTDCPVCGTTPENCSPVICNCETLCAEDAVNTECPVCSTNAANCSPKEPETPAVCSCTVTCTEDMVNPDCEVCTADWSKCGIQADPAPTEATPTITVNTNNISNLSFSPDAAPAIGQDYTAGIAPVEGYTLPETITVTIGADRYTVNLNGENEDGKPDFEGGKLIIPSTLLTGETTITIEAAGVAVPADEDNSGEDNSDEDNPPPADDSTQPTGGEETQPSADDSPDEETPPSAEDSPDEETQPSADESTQPPTGEDTQPPADDNTQPPADNSTQPPTDGNNDVPEQPEQPEATEGGSTGVDPPTE